ncbi:MAG: glycosyltransferase family 2 protein [Candidatus Pacearchaeota archaeon]
MLRGINRKALEDGYKEQTPYEKELENALIKIKFKDKNDYPFVSIVFPNWNGKKVTIECIESLERLNYPKERMEIVISDNGSSDESIEVIKKKFNKIKNQGWYSLKLIENKENLGPAKAYNLGIKNSNPNYDYIWKLDNDVELDKNALIELVKVAESNEKIGFVGSKVYYFNYGNNDLLWHTGGYINYWFGYTTHYGKDIYDKGQYESLKIPNYLVGCSYLVKKKIIQEIGLIDERYFIYGDDTEWCLRNNSKGFLNVYAPKSKVWHKIKPKTNKMKNSFASFHLGKNLVLIERGYAKFYHWPSFFISICILKSLKEILIYRDLSFFKGIIRGFFI